MYVKKLIISVIALGTPIVNFAGSTEPACTTGNATVPCVTRAWDFGIQALYLNSSYSAPFTQTSLANTPPDAFILGPARLTSNSVTNKSNTRGWAFKLEGGYHFLNGNDLNLNWYNYSSSTTNHLQRDSIPYSFIQDELTSATFFSDVAFSLNTKWNAVNLELGQHVDFFHSTSVRFHGGFQYTNIQTSIVNLIASYNTANEASEYINITNSSTTMKYSGFGPRVGIDLFYNVNQALNVYGKAASALLIGSNSFNQLVEGSYTGSATGIFNLRGPANFTSSGSTTIVVPEIEAKVGGNYIYVMTNSSLTFDAGWIWASYFNAQNTSASPNGFGGAVRPIQTQLNFQIQGVYFGLRWLGNLA